MRIGTNAGAALLGLLLTGDGFACALTGASVGARALATYGQATAMTTSLVGTDLDLAPDIRGDFATQITFDLVVGLDPVTKRDHVLVGQLVDAEVAADLSRLQSLQGTGLSDAVDVGEGHLEPLVAREVNSNKACHQVSTAFRLVDACLWATPFDKLRAHDVAEVSGVMRPRLPSIRSRGLITGASASDRGWVREPPGLAITLWSCWFGG